MYTCGWTASGDGFGFDARLYTASLSTPRVVSPTLLSSSST